MVFLQNFFDFFLIENNMFRNEFMLEDVKLFLLFLFHQLRIAPPECRKRSSGRFHSRLREATRISTIRDANKVYVY